MEDLLYVLKLYKIESPGVANTKGFLFWLGLGLFTIIPKLLSFLKFKTTRRKMSNFHGHSVTQTGSNNRSLLNI